MANLPFTIDPIPLPDPRRPEKTPSLPAWLAHSSAAARLELQLSPDGARFEDVMTLAANLMPSPDQRAAIESHLASLNSYLQETPESSDDAAAKIAASVTNLLLVLPSSKRSDVGSEARADVYLDVLDDLPWWAVKAACRRWLRHECGVDERGVEHDYRWCPDPGTLRRVALDEVAKIRYRMSQLRPVIEAREFVDCTEMLERGRAAIAGLSKARQMGIDYGKMTFDEAIELGRSEDKPADKQEAAE